METRVFLDELAAKAASYEFPMLDNAYWNFVAGRMRGFKDKDRFALVFELLIFHTQAQQFFTNIYGFGNLLHMREGDLGAFPAIGEMPEHPLWDDEGEWRRDLRVRLVSIQGVPVAVHSSPADVSTEESLSSDMSITLSHGDDADEGVFAAALVRELGNNRLLSVTHLRERVPELANATEVLRLSNWDHPDIAGGQNPGDSRAITEAAKLLTGQQEQFTFDHSRDNVDYRSWAAL